MNMDINSSRSQILEVDGVRLLKVRRRIRKGKRPLWSDQEVRDMIDIVSEKKLLPSLTRRKYGRYEIFQVIAEELKKKGYTRSTEQINTKWKQLRLSYNRVKVEESYDEQGSLNLAIDQCPFYDELEELYTGKVRPKRQPQPIQPGTFIQIDPSHLMKIDPSQLIRIDSSNCIMMQHPPVLTNESKQRIYSNSIENNAWLTKVLETSEKDWEDSRMKKEKELTDLRHWEEKLVEKQRAALSKANEEFLKGLKEIVDMFKT